MRKLLRTMAIMAAPQVKGERVQALALRECAPSGLLQYVSPENIRVAALSLPLESCPSVAAYVRGMQALVGSAVAAGAQLAVLPELSGMLALSAFPLFPKLLPKLLALDGEQRGPALRELLTVAGRQINGLYLNTFSALARGYGILIAPGSSYVLENDRVYNRSLLFGPSGAVLGAQDKLALSPDERAWGVSAGVFVNAIDTPLGRVALLSGADAPNCEPFEVARELGARIIAAGTSPWAGELSALRWRAQENAVYILSPGYVEGSLAQSQRQGRIYAPLSLCRGSDGVLADVGAVVCARLDLGRLIGAVDLYAVSREGTGPARDE